MAYLRSLTFILTAVCLLSCTTVESSNQISKNTKSDPSSHTHEELYKNEQISEEAVRKYITIDHTDDYQNVAQIALPNSSSEFQGSSRLGYEPLDLTEDLVNTFNDGSVEDDKKVIGGSLARLGQFPWHVAIELKGVDFSYGYFCGGTLIDSTTVLTAAHCFYKTKPIRQFHFENNISIAYGSNLQNELKSVEVDRIIPHPDYTHIVPDNDLAIVKLKHPIQADGVVNYASLPTSPAHEETGYELHMYGFGRYKENSLDVSKKLFWGEVPFLDNTFCDDFELYDGDLPDTHFCAGDPVGGAEACKGDSGGGLIDPNSNSVVGVTSYGDPECKLDGRPAIYTNVKQFDTWIKRHMEEKPTVWYFEKESDPPIILEKLKSISSDLQIKQTRRLTDEGSNAIWVGSRVEFGQFKYLVTELVKSGAQIKRIAPSCRGNRQRKTNIIQVGTSPKVLSNDTSPLELGFIENAKSYQDIFTGSGECG